MYDQLGEALGTALERVSHSRLPDNQMALAVLPKWVRGSYRKERNVYSRRWNVPQTLHVYGEEQLDQLVDRYGDDRDHQKVRDYCMLLHDPDSLIVEFAANPSLQSVLTFLRCSSLTYEAIKDNVEDMTDLPWETAKEEIDRLVELRIIHPVLSPGIGIATYGDDDIMMHLPRVREIVDTVTMSDRTETVRERLLEFEKRDFECESLPG